MATAAAAGAVQAARVGLLYDERMCAHAPPDGERHPEDPERLRAIWRKLKAEGITRRCTVLKGKEAEDKDIASVHSQNHIKLIRNISSREYDSCRNKIAAHFNDIYFNEGSSESAFLAAGSVIEVAEKVASGELDSAIALVRPPGHHAEHNKAMGFCLFNNVAVAANFLLNERPELGIEKILIVDWDVHHGNGTQKMFYNDPRVLFFSVHRFDYGAFYPSGGDGSSCFIGEGAGKGYNINVPWEHRECGDADYIAAWDHILLPVTKVFDPDIILISAGFDAALGDPLGGCCITPNGYSCLLRKLCGFAQGRIVMALEGGYSFESIANSVFACAKVLLGDKLSLESPKLQPFESTWQVIQEVRDELKTCWPVLATKLPENISLRSKPSPEFSSTGSESDVVEVDEHPPPAFVKNVSIVAIVSSGLSGLGIVEGNAAKTTISSCSSAANAPIHSIEAHTDAALLAAKRIYDPSIPWRSVLSNIYVWYASYGSNMWKPRFLCYIEGGKVEGMSIPCRGSLDKSPPRDVMWRTFSHRLFFGRSFTPCWGAGGVAFLHPKSNSNERSYLCMYKITLEQFNDVLFQENSLVEVDTGDKNIIRFKKIEENIESPLIGLPEIDSVSTRKALHLEAIKDSWYSNVLYLGKKDNLPILTMTCPLSDVERCKSGEIPLSAPSETYAGTLIKGLVQGKRLNEDEATNYINAAAARDL